MVFLNMNIIEELLRLSKTVKDEVPVAAIIEDEEGNILSKAANSCEEDESPLSHAEIKAIEKATKGKRHNLKGCTIYITLEPCLMCYGAILNSEISNVIYLVRNEDNGAFSYFHADTQKNKVLIHCLENEEAKKILQSFFFEKRLQNK